MILTINDMMQTKLMPKGIADDLSKKLNSEDDELFYKAVHCPKGTGLSYICVYEDDELIGKL